MKKDKENMDNNKVGDNFSAIDLWPKEPYDNYRKVVDFLSKATGHIWIMNYYFLPKHFKIFRDVIDEKPNFDEIRLLLKTPKSIEDLKVLKEEFDRFRKQFKDFSVQIKFFTDSELKKDVHDRFLFTKNMVYNFVELDSIYRNQRCTIYPLNGKDFERNVNENFLVRWNDKKTYDLIGQWNKLIEVVGKLESSLKKEHEDQVEINKQGHKHQKTIFTYFKTNKGITVESKDKVPIELHDAIKECENLEIYNEYNGLPYIGFYNTSTHETVQFMRISEEKWYADSPIINRMIDDWEGYVYKSYGTWSQVKETLELFFEEEYWRGVFEWKISLQTKGVSDEVLEKIQNRRNEAFADLK